MSFSANPLQAAELRITPGCDLREEYNDNIFLSTVSRRSDFVTVLFPSIELARTAERLNVNLLAGLNWLTYLRSHDRDSLDFQYNGSLGFRLSERTQLSSAASYTRESRPNVDTQRSGVSSSSGSDRQNYSFGLSKVLGEKTTGSTSYAFGKTDYDDPALLGVMTHNAGIVVSRDLADLLPTLKGTSSINFGRSIYSNSTTDNYSLTTGLSMMLNERLNCSTSVGGRYTHSSFEVLRGLNLPSAEDRRDDWGIVGMLAISYVGEREQGSFSMARDFSASSGQTGATEVTSFSLSLRRRFSERWGASILGSYSINQESSGQYSGLVVDDRTFRFSSNVNYELTKDLNVGLQYSYYNVDYRKSGSRVDQNMVALSAQLRFPQIR